MIEIQKNATESVTQNIAQAQNMQVWVISGDVQAEVVAQDSLVISGGSPGTHQVLVRAPGADPDLQHITVTVGE